MNERMKRVALVMGMLAVAALASSCVGSRPAAAQWTPLFNGKDLSGWTVKCLAADQSKTFWSVTNGVIQCDSIGRKDHNYVWLVSGREFGDFELRLKFQAFRDSPGNSGLQFRSRWDESWRAGQRAGPARILGPFRALGVVAIRRRLPRRTGGARRERNPVHPQF